MHLRDRNLDVVASKGNRVPRLPLTVDVTEVLAGCDRVTRARFGPSRGTFFVSATGNQVTAATVGKIFQRIWDQAGLPRPAGGQQPTALRLPSSLRLRQRRTVDGTGQGRHRDAALPGPLHGARAASSRPTTTSTPRRTSCDAYDHITAASQSLLPEVGFDET